MAWVRKGDCPPERCQGRCCHHLCIWFPKDNPDSNEYVEVLKTRGVPFIDADTMQLADIHQTCQHLTPEGLCGIYGQPERPDFCARWPEHPSQLLADPYCGFTFEWVEDKEPTHG